MRFKDVLITFFVQLRREFNQKKSYHTEYNSCGKIKTEAGISDIT